MKTLSVVVVVVMILAGGGVGAQDGAANPSLLKASFSKLPIHFIENRGVYPDEVAYYVQGADKTLFFTKDGITFRLKDKGRDWVVKLDFVGANPEVVARGEDRQQAVFSYFRGPEKDWKTGLRTFSKIVYRELWPGIDLVYRAGVGVLKYEFLVAPGADPAAIRLRYRGVISLTTTDAGALRVETPEGGFEDAAPEAWQEMDGERVRVGMRFRLDPDHSGDVAEFGFGLGDYDHNRPLVLDPAVLVYCGYIGGSYDEQASDVAVDASANAYVIGNTISTQAFPVKTGPDLTHNGSNDVFVAKISATGDTLIYCGYIGGTGPDWDGGIAVDASGNAYVTGTTASDGQTFPVKVGPNLTHWGKNDAFVAKVNPQGTALVYCGYIGGNNDDGGSGIAVDAAGSAYVTGPVLSDEHTFPVKVGPDLTQNGLYDAFVAKVNPQGSALVYCGYVGGSRDEWGNFIAVDAAGSAYICGKTESTEQQGFPVTVGPDLTYNGGADDAFVAKVNKTGTALAYCGYVGGSSSDKAHGIAVDTSGSAYVAGDTQSNEQTFPVTVGPDLTYNGGAYDAFVARLNPSGTGLDYCGYIGGSGDELGRGIALDTLGNAYVTGATDSTAQTFPVTVGPDLTHNGGGDDAFVAKVGVQGTALVYCGYIGGSGSDAACGIAVDAAGNAYVMGQTTSDETTFPVKVGPGLTYRGSFSWQLGDAFVAKVALTALQGSGTPRPGETVSLVVAASDDGALPYQVGSSLGTGPIPIDTRQIGLSADYLLVVTVGDLWPSIFSGYRGVMDSKGQAQAAIHIPNIPALIGIHLHTAFVTLDPKAPSGIKSISNTFSFPITK